MLCAYSVSAASIQSQPTTISTERADNIVSSPSSMSQEPTAAELEVANEMDTQEDDTPVVVKSTPAASPAPKPPITVLKPPSNQPKVNTLFSKQQNKKKESESKAAAAPVVSVKKETPAPADPPLPVTNGKRKEPPVGSAPEQAEKKPKVEQEEKPSPAKPKGKKLKSKVVISDNDDDGEATEDDERLKAKKKKAAEQADDPVDPDEVKDIDKDQADFDALAAKIKAKKDAAKAKIDAVTKDVGKKTKKRIKKRSDGFIADQADEEDGDDDEDDEDFDDAAEAKKQKGFIAPEDDGTILNPAVAAGEVNDDGTKGSDDGEEGDDDGSQAEEGGDDSEAEVEAVVTAIKERAKSISKKKKAATGETKTGGKKSTGKMCIICETNIPVGWAQLRVGVKRQTWAFLHPDPCFMLGIEKYGADGRKAQADDKPSAAVVKEKKAPIAADDKKKKKDSDKPAAAAEKKEEKKAVASPKKGANKKKETAATTTTNSKNKPATKAEFEVRLKKIRKELPLALDSMYNVSFAKNNKNRKTSWPVVLMDLCADAEMFIAWRKKCDDLFEKGEPLPEAPDSKFDGAKTIDTVQLYYGLCCDSGFRLMRDFLDKAFD